tara:strand:+ start:12198 stop:12557 length:360 start_codon:yes stop_codon:yes gene_type:complete
MSKYELLYAIVFQMERAQRAYQYYRNEQVYLHACNIYKGNNEMASLLTRYGWKLDNEIYEGSLDLLEHLDVWLEQFYHLKSELNPSPQTKFIFERFKGTRPFPQGFRQQIEKELKKVKG